MCLNVCLGKDIFFSAFRYRTQQGKFNDGYFKHNKNKKKHGLCSKILRKRWRGGKNDDGYTITTILL